MSRDPLAIWLPIRLSIHLPPSPSPRRGSTSKCAAGLIGCAELRSDLAWISAVADSLSFCCRYLESDLSVRGGQPGRKSAEGRMNGGARRGLGRAGIDSRNALPFRSRFGCRFGPILRGRWPAAPFRGGGSCPRTPRIHGTARGRQADWARPPVLARLVALSLRIVALSCARPARANPRRADPSRMRPRRPPICTLGRPQLMDARTGDRPTGGS